MTIKAYTFESSQTAIDGSQLAPYTSKVDSRVNRDLFNGHGDLIIVGDRNGKINRDVIRSNIEQLVTDGLKFSIPASNYHLLKWKTLNQLRFDRCGLAMDKCSIQHRRTQVSICTLMRMYLVPTLLILLDILDI